MEYILTPKDRSRPCIFCGIEGAPAGERQERHVVVRTPHAFVMMNRYPFAAGHLLVVPYAHVDALDRLEPGAHDALFQLVRETATRLRRAVGAEGLNVGVNLGAPAGAGVAEHLHVHVVPRWSGDTNFMPVLADARVVPQALDETRRHLVPHFADVPGALAEGEI
jgi:ATP adenylyltransferase